MSYVVVMAMVVGDLYCLVIFMAMGRLINFENFVLMVMAVGRLVRFVHFEVMVMVVE